MKKNCEYCNKELDTRGYAAHVKVCKIKHAPKEEPQPVELPSPVETLKEETELVELSRSDLLGTPEPQKTFSCSDCGATVSMDAVKCPACGEVFE